MAKGDANVFYSGMNSRTTGRRATPTQEKKAEAIDKKVEARGKLMPAADIVFEAIDAEKRKAYEKLAKLPLPTSIEEGRVIARLEAVQMHIEFLDTFSIKMQNVLRQAAKKQKSEDENDG